MRRRRILPGWFLVPVLALLLSSTPLIAGGAEDVRKAGWEEDTPGRWNSLAERTVEAGDDFLRADIVLIPGTGVRWEKRIKKDPGLEEILAIELVSNGINRTSRDYRRFEAGFPCSVTVVFGEDSVDRPWKERFKDFFREVRHGFAPGGIRLTYAWGNEVPVESMFRLGEEETVFVLGAEGERGKRMGGERRIKEDFRAAYGRDPRGPVTRILVSAVRPSGEEGRIEVGIRLSSPLLK